LDTPASPPVEIVPISRLFCSPTNPRNNDAAVPHVAASIRRFGWQQPIVARRTGEVIAGNTRLKAVQQLGMQEVPVWWFDAVGAQVHRSLEASAIHQVPVGAWQSHPGTHARAPALHPPRR